MVKLPRPDTVASRILEVLERRGPMDMLRIASAIDHETSSVSATMTVLLKRGLVHYPRYRWIETSRSVRLFRVWAAGPGENAEKPKPLTNTDRHRRWVERTKKPRKQGIASVFDLGKPQRAPLAKRLSASKVRAVRSATGSAAEIAAQLHITKSQASKVLSGTSYRGVR